MDYLDSVDCTYYIDDSPQKIGYRVSFSSWMSMTRLDELTRD